MGREHYRVFNGDHISWRNEDFGSKTSLILMVHEVLLKSTELKRFELPRSTDSLEENHLLKKETLKITNNNLCDLCMFPTDIK